MSSQNNNENVFQTMALNTIFSENFLKIYVDDSIVKKFYELDFLDKTLSDLNEDEIEFIENILEYPFKDLKYKAVNYLIIKKMSDLDII